MFTLGKCALVKNRQGKYGIVIGGEIIPNEWKKTDEKVTVFYGENIKNTRTSYVSDLVILNPELVSLDAEEQKRLMNEYMKCIQDELIKKTLGEKNT